MSTASDGSENIEKPSNPTTVILRIPLVTILKIVGTLAAIYFGYLLSSLLMVLFLAVMVAVTIYPMFQFLSRRNIPRWIGVTSVISVIFGLTALVAFVILPPLADQTSRLIQDFPHLRDSLLAKFPPNSLYRSFSETALRELQHSAASKWLNPVMSVGIVAVDGATQLFLVLIFSVYFLVDGPHTVLWILAFFSANVREKLRSTATEMSTVISAYVAGQVITSVVCFLYSLVVLSLLHVPSALMLATIAGLLDILPVLGFFLAAIPAVLLSLTVSPLTALAVLALYVLYHVLESYILVPKVYGNRLRLSDLVVLLSLLAAGSLAGVLGALSVLPIVASYPIIERIWLVEFLGRGVVRKHALATENEAAGKPA